MINNFILISKVSNHILQALSWMYDIANLFFKSYQSYFDFCYSKEIYLVYSDLINDDIINHFIQDYYDKLSQLFKEVQFHFFYELFSYDE